MTMNMIELLNSIKEYTNKTMAWCIRESEAEATKVYNILKDITDDASRRAQVSSETVDAIKNLQAKIAQPMAGKTRIPFLVKALEQLSKEHAEISQVTDPIIMALQFQDRLRQNLENINKMIDVWHAERPQFNSQHANAESAMQAIGNKFLACMTSVEERELVRRNFPGLPVEKAADDALFF